MGSYFANKDFPTMTDVLQILGLTFLTRLNFLGIANIDLNWPNQIYIISDTSPCFESQKGVVSI